MPWKGVGPDSVWSDPAFAWYRFGYSRKGGIRLSGGQQTEGGGVSHRSPPGDRPPKRRCPVLSSTGNTPGDSPSTASGGRVYGLFTGYRRMGVSRRLKPPEIVSPSPLMPKNGG